MTRLSTPWCPTWEAGGGLWASRSHSYLVQERLCRDLRNVRTDWSHAGIHGAPLIGEHEAENASGVFIKAAAEARVKVATGLPFTGPSQPWLSGPA